MNKNAISTKRSKTKKAPSFLEAFRVNEGSRTPDLRNHNPTL